MLMLKNNSRHIRKFYFPGLISLIFLPALCLWFISTNKTYEKLYALDVVFWSPSLKIIFPESYRHGSHPPRKYLEIDLIGNDKEDKVKLDFAQIQIRDLVATNDVKNGVHFQFGNKSKYWEFIRALDICKIANARTFVADGDNIWVFNHIPKKNNYKTIPFVHRCSLCNDVIYEKPKPDIENEKRQLIVFFKESIKKYCIPLLIFLAMSIFGLRELIK